MGQDAARQESVELILHKLRSVGAGCGLSLIKEGSGLLHQAVQRGLLGSVAPLVGRDTIQRPARRMWLPAHGLHARLPRW